MNTLPTPSIEARQRRGRAPKFHGIADALRREVLGGDYVQGQLPSLSELAQRFQTTNVTVQKAVSVLKEDGLVEVRAGSGTYVTGATQSRLPVVLVLAGPFVSGPFVSGHSSFLEALGKEARRLQREGHNLVLLEDAGSDDAESGTSVVTRLVLEHRIGGIVFVFDTYERYAGTPLVDEPHIPRERIGVNDQGVLSGVGPHGYDGGTYERVLEYFVKRGRHRVALIRNVQSEGQLAKDPFPKMAAQLGLETHPWWIHGVLASRVPDSAERIVELLAHGDPAHRPDALIISDDNLVPYATRGLREAGLRVPEEIDVVAHASFPWPAKSHVPIRRIGFDVRQILDRALDSIAAQRQGKTFPKSDLPCQWEEDIGEQSAVKRKGD